MVKYLTRYGTIALITALAGVCIWSLLLLNIRESQLTKEQAAHQATQLTHLGLIRAKPKQTSRLGEGDVFVERVRERTLEVGAHPVVSISATTEPGVIDLPIPGVPCVTVPTDEGGPSSTTTLASISVQARISALLASTARGEVFGDGQVEVTLQSRGDSTTEPRTTTLPITKDSTFEISKDMQAALRAYYTKSSRFRLAPRPIREWRVGLSTGVGACLSSDIRPCAYIGVGVQF